MSIFDFFLVLFISLALAALVAAANYADRNRNSRVGTAVKGVVLLVNLVIVLNSALTVATAYDNLTEIGDAPDKTSAWGGLVASLFVVALASALVFRPVRERLSRIFPRFRGKRDAAAELDRPGGAEMQQAHVMPQSQQSGEPLFPQMLNYFTTSSVGPRFSDSDDVGPVKGETVERNIDASYKVRGFNPASNVHMLALVFVVYLLGSQLIDFVVSGGLSGLAESYSEEGLNAWSLLSNSFPFLIIPFVGVGLGMRRNLRQSLERLGLGRITGEGVAVSIAITFALLVGLFIIGTIWMLVVPEEVYEEQTQATEALSKSVTTVGLAFMLAATAAIGEEIAFRGALQPVIGFWATALVFALTHTQYALTPAMLIIFGVAIAFGWIRQRYNTTVAILTHFWYNLIQLLLLFVAPEQSTESIVRLFSGIVGVHFG